MTNSESAICVVRPAHTQDVAELVSFIEPFVELGQLLPRTPDELDGLVHHGFVAVIGDRIVGFAALEVYSKKLAEVRSLAVDPNVRGLGVGKRLVQACVDRAKEMHVLEVMAVTATEEFFRACGFDFTLPGQKKAMFIQTRDEV